ncbi:MAG: hypothetical protein U0793_24015 [Gemmataceae bacterium]
MSVTMADGANTFVGGVLSDFTGSASADQFLILDPTRCSRFLPPI